jgi:hypothetical protein
MAAPALTAERLLDAESGAAIWLAAFSSIGLKRIEIWPPRTATFRIGRLICQK